MNLKTIPDGISPREVREKMNAGLTQDQAVDVISKQHEYDLAHPNAALARIKSEKAKREADAEADERRKKEAQEAGKEHAKSEKTAAQLADDQKKEEEELEAELNEKAEAKRQADLEAAAKAKNAAAQTGAASDDNLNDMTIPELKELAEKRNVDLTGVTRKDEIIDAIKDQTA